MKIHRFLWIGHAYFSCLLEILICVVEVDSVIDHGIDVLLHNNKKIEKLKGPALQTPNADKGLRWHSPACWVTCDGGWVDQAFTHENICSMNTHDVSRVLMMPYGYSL
jgi:hypothetical protein